MHLYRVIFDSTDDFTDVFALSAEMAEWTANRERGRGDGIAKYVRTVSMSVLYRRGEKESPVMTESS